MNPRVAWLILGVLLSVGVCIAQYRPNGRREFAGTVEGPLVQTEGGVWVDEDTVRTARETASHSTGTPNWSNRAGFERDVFTFTRIIFKSGAGGRGWRPSWFGWVNDYPDSDLNLSFRLQQLTSMKVDPNGRVLKLTDPALHEYPLIFMGKPGFIELTEPEVLCLRAYLSSGGVLWADDFWGAQEWDNFAGQMEKVLPGRDWAELPMEHRLFHAVYDLKVPKDKLQVPYIRAGLSSLNPDSPNFGNSAQYGGEDAQHMHVRAWHDDKQRIVILATHNTNSGDGWEREGENTGYFHEYSENRAYPLAINIVVYLMTH